MVMIERRLTFGLVVICVNSLDTPILHTQVDYLGRGGDYKILYSAEVSIEPEFINCSQKSARFDVFVISELEFYLILY